MLGKLSNEGIELLLKKQVIGRLGCHADGETYVVPVNYVYNGNAIYSHSSFGKKIEMMRKNPKVCFEVDDIQTIFRWQSIIAWGHYEEITGEAEKHRAMQLLIHTFMPLTTDPAGHPSHGISDNESEIDTKIDLIVYRINLDTKTGRFEGGSIAMKPV